ncbi:uncharacterized protein MCYG_04353 [Microsporum canis CBS 113480]|uniref:Uncharacterized protein n=1 Tax=Arthroderma otae (strain ATCC MYA-4605 / CBS 113480) TaxID=554155 RepID=C5FPL8_ARTOC|nr:uncharacterized protein MCYG_04353 [Microsporum canis CBS 113480]EEQ31534.1 predicted protein [Microsporum canis CBS 113480]
MKLRENRADNRCVFLALANVVKAGELLSLFSFSLLPHPFLLNPSSPVRLRGSWTRLTPNTMSPPTHTDSKGRDLTSCLGFQRYQPLPDHRAGWSLGPCIRHPQSTSFPFSPSLFFFPILLNATDIWLTLAFRKSTQNTLNIWRIKSERKERLSNVLSILNFLSFLPMCQKAFYIHVCGHRSWGPLNRCENRYVCPPETTGYYPVYLTSPCRFCRTSTRRGRDAGRGRGRGRAAPNSQAQNTSSPVSPSRLTAGYPPPHGDGEPSAPPSEKASLPKMP